MSPSHLLNGKKILIVDDELDILETLTDLLDTCVTDTVEDFENATLLEDALEEKDPVAGTNGKRFSRVKGYFEATYGAGWLGNNGVV